MWANILDTLQAKYVFETLALKTALLEVGVVVQ